jgi:flagellar basal body-associated protein FliL
MIKLKHFMSENITKKGGKIMKILLIVLLVILLSWQSCTFVNSNDPVPNTDTTMKIDVVGMSDSVTLNINNINVTKMPKLGFPERGELKERAKQCVSQLHDYITGMTAHSENGHPSKGDRNTLRKAALNLFLADGDSIVVDMNGPKGSPVQIEITFRSSNNAEPQKKTTAVRDYFTNLIKLVCDSHKYTDVKIEYADVELSDVSDPKPISDTLWQCTVAYTQTFIGRRNELTRYADTTKKTIQVYIIVHNTVKGVTVEVRLGDIAANETIRI